MWETGKSAKKFSKQKQKQKIKPNKIKQYQKRGRNHATNHSAKNKKMKDER